MSAPDPRMRWWGWGVDSDATSLPDKAREMLRQAFSVEDEPAPPVQLDAVRLPDLALPEKVRTGLASIVGDGAIRDDRLARVAHALGKSYPDLVRARSGDAASAPDAVVYPGSHDEVVAVLELCAAARIAVVPFGGGSSVVGGVEPRREGFDGAISLDLARMDRMVASDPVSLTATFEPGCSGPRVEELLAAEGLTLGHFPQSWEYATLGGFVATRSAGRASTGYGRIDELVLGVRLAAPEGTIDLAPLPASAAGPKLRDLIVGSEGALGVITQATLAVRPRPAVKLNEGWVVDSWQAGCDALRAMEQAGEAADVCRLSDEAETALNAAASGHDAPGPCLAVVGWEGEGADVTRRAERTRGHLERAGARPLGEEAGARAGRNYFAGPYLRDELLGMGVLVETLETATTWSRLQELYAGVGDALRSALEERGTPAMVMCHVSHLYRSGASLYFSFFARQERGAELEQWHAAKTAACDAIVAHGGTITHHHAIGRDHAPWMTEEIGELGVEAIRAVKGRLDPAGIMNPGKLIPEQPG
ncbi:MAG: alkyldihydroxyacetonephosphate synthase [Thermoleophilaceae bacterium]|nr:alkyldihydroxyacetonephosphate synthase [Thermoleophilaceae bacterium]